MIPPAQASGRLTMITNAMAREITVGKDGKAEAVVYIDKTSKTEKRLNAKHSWSPPALANRRDCC